MRWHRILIGLGKSRHCQTWRERLKLTAKEELNFEIYYS